MHNWREIILSDEIGLRHGYQFRETDFVENGIPVVKIGNVTDEGLKIDIDVSFVSSSRVNEFQDIIIKDGDILMSLTGNIGRVVEVEDLGHKILFQNYRVGVFYPLSDKIYKRYIKWILSSTEILRQLTNYSNQSAQANFGKQDLDKLKFKIPSLPVQHRIATILSTVDVQIEKTEAIIAKYQAIKQGMLHDLFTRGIDIKTGNLRPLHTEAPQLYKDSPLGMIPKEWEIVKLGTITEKIGSGVTPTGGSEVYKTEGVLFIRSQNVLENELSLNDAAYISKEIDNKMLGSRVQQYDVLLNITGASIGRCAYYPFSNFSANVNQHVCIIRFKKEQQLMADFTTVFLNSYLGQSQINRLNAGGNREGLNYAQIRSFNVPVIDRSELRIMNEKNNLQLSVIDKEKSYLEKLKLLKQGLMSDLLSGKVEVIINETATI